MRSALAACLAGQAFALGPDLPSAPPSAATSAPADATDLGISSVVMTSDPPVPGSTVTFNVTVQVSGACDGCGPVSLTYWDDSADGNVRCEDGLSVPVSLENAGEVTVPVTLNGYPRPGSYRAWFWIDCADQIAEADETNNRSHVGVTVLPIPGDPPPPSGESPPAEHPPDDGSTGSGDLPEPPEQVGGAAPDESNPPPDGSFCGLLAGESLGGVAAWMASTLVGLGHLKRMSVPRRPRR